MASTATKVNTATEDIATEDIAVVEVIAVKMTVTSIL
jgi:hypothetical protein